MKQHLKRLLFSSKFKYYIFRYVENILTNSKGTSYGTDIVVCGLNRSGSTLTYNIVDHILKKSFKPSLGFFPDEKSYLKELNRPTYSLLRKTHNFSITLKRRIENKQTLGIFTHRHLLDVIASLIEKGWIKDVQDFVNKNGVEKLVNNSILIAEIEGIIIISYDELLTKKEKVIRKIAYEVGTSLGKEEILSIIDETSIEKTQSKISKMNFEKVGNDLVNNETGLHQNHINNPATGKWTKVLSDHDVNLIVERKAYREYNNFFDYD